MRASVLKALVVALIAFQALVAVGRACAEPDQGCLCSIQPPGLQPAIVGSWYSQAFDIGGNFFSCRGSWAWHTAGQLPPGLSFGGRILSGTLTAPGTFSFSVFAVRSGSNACELGHEYTLIVTASPQVIEVAPSSGAASGGAPIAVTGTGFSQGATLTLGGAIANNVVVVSATQITASAPALGNGTLNDVAVTGTTPLSSGWLADFFDVPQGDVFHGSVEAIFRAGITAGCGGGNYCPGNGVTRAQTAVFILKGRHGGTYSPPACSTTIFTDEPCPGGPLVDWVNQLASENITGGCGGGHYCPSTGVTRGQMAVFLLKGEHGGSYVPPACSGTAWTDVPCPGGPFVDWVNELGIEQIAGFGCGNANWCPYGPVTRGPMADFLVATFRLPLYGP